MWNDHRRKRREDVAPRYQLAIRPPVDATLTFLVTENDEALMIDPTDDAGGCLLCR